MFAFIKNDEDARNLYDIFVKVMAAYKDKGLSDQELFNIIEFQYYTKYLMDSEVNAYANDENDRYGEFVECCYDGYDGYDN